MKGNISGNILGVIVFSMIIVGGLWGFSYLSNVYAPSATTSIKGLDKINELSTKSQELQEKITSQGTNTATGADVILTGGWLGILGLFEFPAIIYNVIVGSWDATGSFFGLPTPVWFFVGMLALITMYFVLRITGIATRSPSGDV